MRAVQHGVALLASLGVGLAAPTAPTAPTAMAAMAATVQAATAADSRVVMAGTACAYLQRTISSQDAAVGPVFLVSYPSERSGALGHVAFLYDNAVAAIALVGCGQLVQARRIGDAMLLALDHDRYWHDGRLRNGYAAGAVGATPLKLAGWWDRATQAWLEDGYQAGSDTGNMAWAMLALLSLGEASGEARYREGARRLATWIESSLDSRGAGGFTGGSFGEEPVSQPLRWKSTEHNTDLAAAFERLERATGDAHWREHSVAAAHFVAAMWDARHGCFAVGTGEDGVGVNALLALDAQVWPLLALPQATTQYAAALSAISDRLRVNGGFAYGQAGGGVWTEGTAQVALLYRLLHREAEARALQTALRLARTPDGGYYASADASEPTGFMLATDPTTPRRYFHLEHLAAAAWVALAEQGFNPFTGARALPHSR